MAGTQVRRGHFAAGVVGLGLLRGWTDPDATAARLGELRVVLDVLDDDTISPAITPTRFGVVDGYTLWAETYDDPGNPLIAVEEPVLRELLPAPTRPGAVAVDAACGTGRVSRLLVDLGYEVRGIDATDAMLDRARPSVPQAAFTVGTLEALPVDDDFAEVTTCCLALNHVDDFGAAVAELARITRPGGRIVLTDLHPFAVLTGGQSSFRGDPDRHRYIDSHARLLGEQLAAFRAAGLEVVACREPLADPVIDEIVAEPLRAAAHAALEGLPFAVLWSLALP